MKVILNLVILLLFLVLFSCKNEHAEKQPAQLIKEWQGKQILFPENPVFTRYLTDTTDFRIPQSEYKVLIYVDPSGCISCKLQLHKWKELIEYTDSVTGGKVPFLFFFYPKDRIEIRYLLKSYEMDRPVCIDLDDRLNKLNHFPADMSFQTFLLDKNNKVIIVGNPIHDIAIKDLYLKLLTGKESPTKNILTTTAKAMQTEIDLGTFKKSDTKGANIEIKNTGSSPLVIMDINTTCGCTAATYDKLPAKPGESLWVGIKVTPKATGFFDEVVTIRCNTIQPVKVKIRGQVQE
ncbi:DUF1573 domain-containing protein [Parabacteroides pacaensis]|uniref:DUF1573 domain-containing protein n=1 Tax=Parabacteroides pacaensis TaxID=2086575 RepID=UPI000D0F04C9|nr:DUF1573 domain-containing protein [Parabacteroides pacaensis]